jgi:predicted transcriptional regulator
MATKAENEKKKELARALFMSGTPQEEIADKVGVSRVSVSKWCTTEGWKEARAARNITRPELVNKLLLTIDKLIEQVSQSEDASQLAGLGDKLSKLASVIQKLDKQANVVDAVEVFMAFNKWLKFRAATDPEVTPELLKAINKYQDKFLIESMSKNSLA